MNRRVVITGTGTVSASGRGLDRLWDACLEGRTGIDRIRRFDPSEYKAQIAAEVDLDFDATDRIDPKLMKRADRFARYGVWAADVAMEHAGLAIDDGNRSEIGVLIGSGIGGMTTWEEQFERLLERGPNRVSPFLVPMMIIDMASGLMSIHCGAMGPNSAVVTACASGAHAIAACVDLIKLGRAKAMITGGTEAGVCRSALAGFCAAQALSTRNDDPAAACRPFDRDRDGFVIGEGATGVIVEDLQYARQRGAPILAEIVGVGLSGDAHHITEPCPDGAGAILAMQNALDDAAMTVEDIDYINAHGPGTPAGDATEALALRELLGEHLSEVPISSTKPVHGHMLGATGPTELALCIKSIHEGIIPHTLNCDDPEPQDLDLVRGQPREAEVNIVMSNSFGFGGHNVTLIIRRFEE
ncbi:MAG: beta-ketoacyl-ACP synthase II [Armatimonadota bacterium]|nr:beta-ketoacyl-ACP synthase II [Armatimonadota bacterium]